MFVNAVYHIDFNAVQLVERWGCYPLDEFEICSMPNYVPKLVERTDKDFCPFLVPF